jgi:hypothetical protein
MGQRATRRTTHTPLTKAYRSTRCARPTSTQLVIARCPTPAPINLPRAPSCFQQISTRPAALRLATASIYPTAPRPASTQSVLIPLRLVLLPLNQYSSRCARSCHRINLPHCAPSCFHSICAHPAAPRPASTQSVLVPLRSAQRDEHNEKLPLCRRLNLLGTGIAYACFRVL